MLDVNPNVRAVRATKRAVTTMLQLSSSHPDIFDRNLADMTDTMRWTLLYVRKCPHFSESSINKALGRGI